MNKCPSGEHEYWVECYPALATFLIQTLRIATIFGIFLTVVRKVWS